MKTTVDDVRAAYRILLGRDPESQAVVEEKLNACPSPDQLLAEFVQSPEFELRSLPGLRERLGNSMIEGVLEHLGPYRDALRSFTDATVRVEDDASPEMFLFAAYLLLLHRLPDYLGFATYIRRLRLGYIDRLGVVLELAGSSECPLSATARAGISNARGLGEAMLAYRAAHPETTIHDIVS